MKNSEVTIRAYQASDLPALSTIWFEASRQVHAFLGDDRLREQRELVESVYLPESDTWVATCNGEPVGFLGLMDAYIGALFVSSIKAVGLVVPWSPMLFNSKESSKSRFMRPTKTLAHSTSEWGL